MVHKMWGVLLIVFGLVFTVCVLSVGAMMAIGSACGLAGELSGWGGSGVTCFTTYGYEWSEGQIMDVGFYLFGMTLGLLVLAIFTGVAFAATAPPQPGPDSGESQASPKTAE